MKTLNVMLSNLGGRVVPIGYEGENLYTRIRINCIEVFSEYPDATVSMVVSPPVGEMYPAVVEKSGVMVIWDITDSVLSSNGSGECQLTFTEGNVVRKSVVFGISINRSLVASGEAPEPVQEWIDRAEQTAQEIAENAANLAKEDIVESYGSIAPAIIETAEGEIATLTDGADGMLVKTLTVDIDPVQDLHGYDNPWPAGGGVNKCPSPVQTTITENGVTFTCDGNGNCSISGTATDNISLELQIDEVVLPSTVYVHLFNSQYYATGTPVIDFYNGSTRVDYVGLTVSQNRIYNGTSAMGDETINKIQIRIPTGFSGTCTFKFYISDSNAVVDFSPYKNSCPISGWDSANVSRTGKNLLDKTKYSVLNNSTIMWGGTSVGLADGSFVLPAGTYTFSSNDYCDGLYVYDDKSRIAVLYGGESVTFTITKHTPIKLHIYIAGSTQEAIYARNYQLELGSTATTYKAFSGSTAEYEFPQEAGTVYGGTLTIHQDGTGTLVAETETDVISSLTASGSFTTGTYACVKRFTLSKASNSCTSNQTHGAIASFGVESPAYWGSVRASEAGAKDVNFAITTSGATLAIYDSDLSLTDETFMQKYGSQQVCYPLASPVSYELTAQQVVSLLKGQNNVWADTGNVSLEYPADTKLYIDGKVAELQALILENISNS